MKLRVRRSENSPFLREALGLWPKKIFNPLVPRAHNSDCQNLLFPLQIKPEKVSLKIIGGFLFLTLGIIGFIKHKKCHFSFQKKNEKCKITTSAQPSK